MLQQSFEWPGWDLTPPSRSQGNPGGCFRFGKCRTTRRHRTDDGRTQARPAHRTKCSEKANFAIHFLGLLCLDIRLVLNRLPHLKWEFLGRGRQGKCTPDHGLAIQIFLCSTVIRQSATRVHAHSWTAALAFLRSILLVGESRINDLGRVRTRNDPICMG